WLHDLVGGGPGVEYAFPAESPSGTAVRERYPKIRPFFPGDAAGFPPTQTGPADAHRVTDDDGRFTVYPPQVLFPERPAWLSVFANKTNRVVEPGRGLVDPLIEVDARARTLFGGAPPSPVGEDARQTLVRGTELRIVPDLPGVRCNPKEAKVEWWEPVHE